MAVACSAVTVASSVLTSLFCQYGTPLIGRFHRHGAGQGGAGLPGFDRTATSVEPDTTERPATCSIPSDHLTKLPPPHSAIGLEMSQRFDTSQPISPEAVCKYRLHPRQPSPTGCVTDRPARSVTGTNSRRTHNRHAIVTGAASVSRAGVASRLVPRASPLLVISYCASVTRKTMPARL